MAASTTKSTTKRKSEKDKRIEALEAELASYKARENIVKSWSALSKRTQQLLTYSLIALGTILLAILGGYIIRATLIPAIDKAEYERILAIADRQYWSTDKNGKRELMNQFKADSAAELYTTVEGSLLALYIINEENHIKLTFSLSSGILMCSYGDKAIYGYLTESATGEGRALVIFSDESKITLYPTSI